MKATETQTASVTEPEDRFERIGTTYYKMVSRPNAAGELIECRIPWTIEAIRQDYGKDFLANVPKYDGFCCVPDHVGYKPVVGTFLNKYAAISHTPREGDFPTIRALVTHIFGDQSDLGMDYMQLLYLRANSTTSVSTTCKYFTPYRCRNFRYCCWCRRNATPANQHS